MAPPKQATIMSFFGKKPAGSPVKTPKSKESVSPAGTGLPPNNPVSPTPSARGSASLGSSSAWLQTPNSTRTNISSDLPSSPAPTKRVLAIDSDSEDDAMDVDPSEHEFEDSQDEYKPDGSDHDDEDDVEHSDEEMKLDVSSVPKKAKVGPHVEAGNNLAKFHAKSEYKASSIRAQPKKKIRSTTPEEERYKWLEDVKDADGNRPDHPDYDPRTLYIPSSAWSKFTPFEKQYWEIKSKLWNTVVFFKKGKFYELYENDAAIAHEKFDLKLAGGGRANMQLAGIPEMSFDAWASTFIANGYKVAKVDQVETALAKEMRDQTAAKKEEKIIRRELKCVLTAGTLTNEAMLVDDLSRYCMAIKQDGQRFASVFVDTATGAFALTEFEDDDDYHHFETLMAQIRPRELVLERGNLDRAANRIIKNNVSVDTQYNVLKPMEEFWDYDTALQKLTRAKYFEAEDLDDFSHYPKVLQDAKGSELLMSAFGGLLWYLRSLKLDEQLVKVANFSNYTALNKGQGTMILDGQTLQNLEVFSNTFDGGPDGTLFKLVNKCVTPFGKRTLRAWVSHPLRDLAQIRARQDAVQLLLDHDELREALESRFLGLPDIERLLSRVHAGSLMPKDFARVVSGLETMANMLDWMHTQDFGLPLLDELLAKAPSIKEILEPWTTAFDHEKAKNEDILVPEPGVEEEFDASNEVIRGFERELETQIKEYRKSLKSLDVCYRDSGKEIYLIEVPARVKVPNDWQKMSMTAKVHRYYSPEVRHLVRQLQEARETHKLVALGVQGRLYARFSENYREWLALTKTVAHFDCLLSLARTSANMAIRCRPEFVESDRPLIEFTELRHPCMPNFIPNDVHLGGENKNLSLLTGANAAGKSTVLRMTGAAVLLAQLGCCVPAQSARLTACDRIMTRLGASDNIFAGKSTFHVELSETERILHEATPNTLVVLDELGRGGSSSDGLAIAETVLHHLATHIGCLGFFATHYGTLIDSFRIHPEVRPQRMGIIVDQDSREVTFLYKLEDGESEGSFGMNVALMCGVSRTIVDTAEEAARNYEVTQRLRKVGFHGVPLGLQSDAIWTLEHTPAARAVAVMKSMSLAL